MAQAPLSVAAPEKLLNALRSLRRKRFIFYCAVVAYIGALFWLVISDMPRSPLARWALVPLGIYFFVLALAKCPSCRKSFFVTAFLNNTCRHCGMSLNLEQDLAASAVAREGVMADKTRDQILIGIALAGSGIFPILSVLTEGAVMGGIKGAVLGSLVFAFFGFVVLGIIQAIQKSVKK